MKKLTLVLSIAAIMSGSAYANGMTDTDSSVELNKAVNVTKDLKYEGKVKIEGTIKANGLGMAVVENVQETSANMVENYYHDNDAKITGSSFEGASGNIGVNQAAGDFNAQSNSAALASIDAGFAFGSGDAEIFNTQMGGFNGVWNEASTNTSTIAGSSFMNATGNIGVNVAAGNNNIQANNMAASTYNGRLGEASVSNVQSTGHNGTMNIGVVQDSVEYATVNLALGASGTYVGTSELNTPYYPQIILEEGPDAGSHNVPPGTVVGHIDFDTENPTGSEVMTFDEAGDIALNGTVSGQLPFFVQTIVQKSNNTSLLGGSAFQNASGNIGVNLASGTGNLQSNNLALTSITGPSTVISAE
ncbi:MULTISPECIES: hypothetical protein [Shewanella]|uniref:Adhesin n=1 Tax=Shewanella psychromarinicola TaxID=2487742 RepID=A0A3N4DLW2_9GAMM|nr:hypothetical protein [Shewanella psychromarinicola]AZG33731.1 hypothetical protein EGC80_01515 [Shewanella psychromarinicola]MCL1084017.1 hypothetical protein [Shewanella psychromarinicola]RPA22610.1 hypothetical protein EGC77_21320 [Shewanella psychromarinicola]